MCRLLIDGKKNFWLGTRGKKERTKNEIRIFFFNFPHFERINGTQGVCFTLGELRVLSLGDSILFFNYLKTALIP